MFVRQTPSALPMRLGSRLRCTCAAQDTGATTFLRVERPCSTRSQCKQQKCMFLGAESDVMDSSIPEEVLLDENAEAEKHSFYMVTCCRNHTLWQSMILHFSSCS